MSRKTLSLPALAVAASLAAPAALAQSKGDWTVAVGAHEVNPDSGNGALADGTLPLDIGSSVRPTLAVEYFVRDNLGIEVLAALPFRHDIDIDRKSTRLNSSHVKISYAVFCLKKKTQIKSIQSLFI